MRLQEDTNEGRNDEWMWENSVSLDLRPKNNRLLTGLLSESFRAALYIFSRCYRELANSAVGH